MGLRGNVALEHLDATPQVYAQIGHGVTVPAPLSELRLQLGGGSDLAAAYVPKQQGQAGPAYRLSRDPPVFAS